MVSIAHWLDTFTCSKYADRFERSGYQNIHSVCGLTIAQLQSLGVANNDIYTIMDNITLLKQSLKSINPLHYLDLNSEPPTSTTRSRTASPAINALNRTMSQNPTAYSPGPNVSTPPTSSGPSPDRILPGPPTFDTPTSYHRSNSYANPINPNTFFDVSPSSSTSSPHRSTSIDALPPQMEPPPFNDYHPQPPPPHSSHQFPPPGMMYRGINPPGGGYYSPHPPRFYSPDSQQQHFMYPNQRMMMHPQQHPPWGGHRPSVPPSMSSHPMHYHPYEQHQYRMPPSQQFSHPNHPIASDQNPMFINQPPPPPSQQHTMNSSTSNKLANAGESHPHPLQSLERLVLLPESQVIDPKSVVNEIHDPQSPFSESLSPYGTSSPKHPVSTPPNTTIVSNLLTNDKSTLEQHTRTSGGLKRSSTHDERSDLNKKNRMNTTNDMNTGDSIISNHPVVTSLLTRGLSTPTSQAPLPSIKSLQQKHNPSFLQQQQQQQQSQSMMFSSSQPDTQPFVDGSIDTDDATHCKVEYIEQDYEELLTKLRSTLNKSSADEIRLSSNTNVVPSQLDGVSESPSTTPKSSTRTSRKRDLSTSSECGTSNSENRSCSPVKVQLDKSNSDTVSSSSNGIEKRRNGSLDHYKSSKRRLSENNSELNSSTNGHHSNSVSSKIQKPKVIQSPTHSNLDDDQSSSSSSSTPQRRTTTELSSKPIREAKKRSLIYTGNTRLFLETAIAAGLMEDNGDEEDEDNEYVPPGGAVPSHSKRPLPSSSSSSTSSSESEDESAKSAGGNSSNSEDESDDNEDDEEEDAETSDNNDEDRKKNSDEMVVDEEPSESGVNWNVKNRPQRRSHLVRFDNISKEDEQKFFGALEEQVPELSAYLNDNSDDEYELNEKEPSDNVNKSIRRSSSKKSQRNPSRDDPEQDEQTVEIIKKFRHVNVPPKRRSTKKTHSNETATISAKNRSDELYVVANDDVTHRIVPGTHLETSTSTKKNLTVQSFYFPRRQIKMNSVEDFKAPWCCILCWKEPYENYLGPLFGPFPLNEQCQGYVQNNKQLPKHYRKLKEVWLHRDCALWNNHIQMNSNTGELMHVSDACMTYLDITCSACKIPGAALACRYRNCKIRYHYSCAKTTVDSRLIEESYSVYCPKHNQMNNNKLKKARAKSMTGTDDAHESSMI